MSYEPGHSHRRRQSKRSLCMAILVTSGWFIAELVAGFYTNSLALIADALHMLTDIAALSLSGLAMKIAERPATHRKTYGYLRAEILAALGNGILLVLVGAYVAYEAYQRLRAPPVVMGRLMLVVAAVGLGVNVFTMVLLYRSQHQSLNVRGAFLHVLGDALGSVGAIVAGICMVFREWYLADPVVSLLVAALIFYSSWKLVRDSVDVLLEGTPRHLDVGKILSDLGAVEGVISVHDLHIWSITSGMEAMSCHVVLRSGSDPSDVLARLSQMMREKHGIDHTTIQVEAEDWLKKPTRIQ
ncbi:MAG: cation transporter [Acidobacteria bacterium]|nr:cation transporter [Acidobacteriota bacterium]